MKCFYYIKLPNGGEVKISANFTKLSLEDEELIDLVEDYYTKKLEGDEEGTRKQITEINKYINTGLHHSSIISILNKETNAEDFIRSVNNTIDKKLNISEVGDAIFSLLKKENTIIKIKKGLSTKISLNEFLEELTKPINKKYFSSIDVNTIINMESVNDKLTDIKRISREAKEKLLNYRNLDSLYNIISSAFPIGLEGELRNSKIFFNASFEDPLHSAVVIKNDPYLPTIFYNESNDLSLFLGVFTYYTSKLDPLKVFPLLEAYNQGYKDKNKINLNLTMDEIFVGYIEDEKFVDPEFFKILQHKTNTKIIIDSLIELVADKLVENSTAGKEGLIEKKVELIKDMQRLFLFISPTKYGHDVYDFTNKAIAESDREYRENEEDYIVQKKAEISEFINKDAIDFHYSNKEEKIFDNIEDLQAFFSGIRLYKDCLTVTFKMEDDTKKSSRFVIPISIENSLNGVVITRGFYSDKGIIRELKNPLPINVNEEFFFRKLENEEPIEDDSKEDAIPLSNLYPTALIEDENGLPISIVKALIEKGSETVYEYYDGKSQEWRVAKNIANRIYPNKIIGNPKSSGYYPEVTIDRIIRFTTRLSLVEGTDKFTSLSEEDRNKFLNTKKRITKGEKNSYLPILPGSFIRTIVDGKNKHNEVIAIEGDNIYILVRMADANLTKIIYKVKAISRKSITDVFLNEISELDMNTLIKVKKEFEEVYLEEHSVRDARYSYFLSKEEAKNGDFVVINNNVYKILDKENKYGIIIKGKDLDYSFAYEKIDLSKATLFITERDISNSNSKTTADINNFVLITADSPEDINKYPHYLNLGYKLIPAKYLLPKKLIKNTRLLNSGNLDAGSLRWDNKPFSDKDFREVTEEVIKKINKETKRRTTGKNLYLLKKDDTSNQIMRYTKSLKEFIIVDRLGEKHLEYEKFKKAINRETTYVMFSRVKGKEYKFGQKLFKVINTVRMNNGDTEVQVEFAGLNNDGKYILIKKSFMLNEAFEKKELKAIYVNYNSKVLKELEKSLDKKVPKSSISEKEELIAGVANKMKSLFNIDTHIVDIQPTEENGLIGKKAWLAPTSEGNTTIVLNKYSITNNGIYNANEQDIVHEFLHLFFIALRYSGNTDLYNRIIELYRTTKMKGKTLSAFDVEEHMVKYLSKEFLRNGYINDLSDLKKSIMSGIIKGINSIKEKNSFEELNELNPDELENLLGSNMKDIFKFKSKNSKMKNTDVVYFDANFRSFLEESIKSKKLKIECK